MNRLLVAIFGLGLVALSASAQADEAFGSFVVIDKIEDTIFLAGPIDENTPLDFRRAMQQRPNATVLMLSSDGGVVPSALLVAQDIHARGLDTYIAAGKRCYSACSFIFLAGRMRSSDGELGVHQMAAAVDDNAGIQASMSYVMEVLGEFEAPPQVISRMLRTPATDMYVFKPDEWREIDKARIASAIEATPVAKPALVALNEKKVSLDALPVERLAVYDGLDFYGADISQGHADNFIECSRACLGDTQCVAFTFNADAKIKTGPNCFLKGGYERLEAFSMARSGLRLKPEDGDAPVFGFGAIDPVVDMSKGQRLSGAAFGTPSKVGNLGECRMSCIGEDSCKAFTYRSNTKQCWMQTTIGSEVGADGYYSGVKRHVSFAAADVIAVE